jgi:hypothetical protein
MVPNLYALSLIEPGMVKWIMIFFGRNVFQLNFLFGSPEYLLETYTVFTEIQSQSSASKDKVISLHDPDEHVRIRQNGRLWFEWTFDWKGDKLKW